MRITLIIRRVRVFLCSVYFNLRYLPFKQAIKLPIIVDKVKMLVSKARFVIDAEQIDRGMIYIGGYISRAYPDTGVTFLNEGCIIFKGKCQIMNDTTIICGKQGKIIFEDNVWIGGGCKIISMCGISFGVGTRLGWANVVTDTNFHPLYDITNQKFKRAYGPIEIGPYNWFGMQCIVMPSVKTPERCIFGARTVVNRGAIFEPYCVHGGSPIRILSRNVMRDYNNDVIKDYSI